jgi:hypothetical protein
MARRLVGVVWLLVVVWVLGGCGVGSPSSVVPGVGVALLGDAHFDGATLVVAVSTLVLEGVEGEGSGAVDVTSGESWLEGELEVVPQAVLAGASGIVAFVRHNPSLTANPWAVYLADQATDVTTFVYGGRRETRSVAVPRWSGAPPPSISPSAPGTRAASPT